MPQEQKQDEEFELIPISPLRRMEKRLEQLESSTKFDTKEFYREMVDIIRMNQQLVDELAKANDALRIELSRLPAKLEELTSQLSELISFIRASATEEVSLPASEPSSQLISRLDQLIDTNKKIVESNQSVLSVLDELEKRLRRPAPTMPFRKPILLQKPTIIR
jgi:methyl-accepting chemotaxis protein